MKETKLPLKLLHRGKVRDMYDLGDRLLMVATDRLSAFDVVLPNPVPYKGATLTGLSEYWFNRTRTMIDNHLITTDTSEFPYPELEGRTMVVRKAERLPAECVVRGYLSGSGWKGYQKTGEVCGIELPEGLVESDKLPEPIFTPTTKEESGHDIPVTQEELEQKVGEDIGKKLKEHSLKIYKSAAKEALKKGIIIADTKFEFGMLGEKIILIDEILTPDSSRFWPRDEYEPGRAQRSFDKQYVRDYLETLDWDKTPPAPQLPEEVVTRTVEKYIEAYERITGKKFKRGEKKVEF